MEVDVNLDIRAGAPVQAERVESGLLSYRSDITTDMTPFEPGLGHFGNPDRDTGCLAFETLCAKAKHVRQIRPLAIEGDALPPMMGLWPVTDLDGVPVGRISSSARARCYNENISIGLIDRSH